MKSDKKTIKHKKDKKVQQVVVQVKKRALSLRHVNSVYVKIKDVLNEARSNTYRVVNFVMVQAYWNIGRLIVEGEQSGKSRAVYGEYLIESISERLKKDYGKGFDSSNLWHMRNFFYAFPILDAVRRELSWTHYRLLLRVDDPRQEIFI